jgi:hypothetical protein
MTLAEAPDGIIPNQPSVWKVAGSRLAGCFNPIRAQEAI